MGSIRLQAEVKICPPELGCMQACKQHLVQAWAPISTAALTRTSRLKVPLPQHDAAAAAAASPHEASLPAEVPGPCPGEETTECYSSKGIPPEAGLPTDMLGEPGVPAPLLAAGDLAADAADLAAAAAEACMAIWIWLSNSTSPFLAFAEASAGMADD